MAELLRELPPELARQVFTHASWTERRAATYERLAFLGDAVLALVVSQDLFARLDAERYGAGRLTQIRAQAVARRSCRAVAERLGLPELLRRAAPDETSAQSLDELLRSEGPIAEVMEAAIGACFEAFGWRRTAAAVRAAFAEAIEAAVDRRVDFKSALQERLARRGETVLYEVTEERGPPHEREFEVVAAVGGRELGRGSGRSKKDAEQLAARIALDRLAVG